jgi:hypothetical protein
MDGYLEAEAQMITAKDQETARKKEKRRELGQLKGALYKKRKIGSFRWPFQIC